MNTPRNKTDRPDMPPIHDEELIEDEGNGEDIAGADKRAMLADAIEWDSAAIVEGLTGADLITERVKRLPNKPGVYRMFNSDGDVLYVNFRKPAAADDSELTDDDVILRYDGDELIGFTVLHASRRGLRP